MDMEQAAVRWAIIGFGGFSDAAMAPAITGTPGHVLAAVCGRDAERTRSLAAKYDVARWTVSVDELLETEGLEAVYIATPNHQHEEMTVRAAGRGLHVLCEKPMAVSLEGARHMVDACRRARVRLSIGNMMRFNPCHTWVRQFIAGGGLGRITEARGRFGYNLPEFFPLESSPWRLDPASSGGGALMDVGVHTIDLLRYLTGLEVSEVTGLIDTRGYPFPVDWCSTVLLRLEDTGALVTVDSSFDNRFRENDLQICGTEGCLSLSGTLWRRSVGAARAVTSRGTFSFDPPAGGPDPYELQVRHFGECIRSGRDPLVSGEEGLRDLAVCLAGYESARAGRTVRLDGGAA